MKSGCVRKFFIGIVVIAVGLFGFYRFWIYPQYTVPILMYHYIDQADWSLSVSSESFERQMKYLKDRRYNVISLDDLVVGKRAGKRFPHNTVVITFDDGAKDNYTEAYPALKQYQFPATIFVITQRMGTAFDSVEYLTWEQVREMSEAGIDFGSHTQHHGYLPDFSREEIMAEVSGSKRDIEKEIGKTIKHFCYPSGGFTEEAKEIIEQSGYLSASTTNRGTDRHNNDLYELKRVKVKNTDAVKPFRFWGKLSGYYNLFRRQRAGH